MRPYLLALLLATGCSTYLVPVNPGVATHPRRPIVLAKLTLRDSSVHWLYKADVLEDSVFAERTTRHQEPVAFAVSDVARLEESRTRYRWDMIVIGIVGGVMWFAVHAVAHID
jgi:hypothetical protein